MASTYKKLPCPVCGGHNYSQGDLVARNLKFEPKEKPDIFKIFNVGHKLPVRLCNDCGNIQVFHENSER